VFEELYIDRARVSTLFYFVLAGANSDGISSRFPIPLRAVKSTHLGCQFPAVRLRLPAFAGCLRVAEGPLERERRDRIYAGDVSDTDLSQDAD
jgi:hypothetical protein